MLITARKSLAQSGWTPLDRFTDRSGNVIRVSSSAAPRYTFDGVGKLIPIDMGKADEIEEIGGKQFAVKTSSPIISGFQRDSTSAIDVVRSDLDWQYPDRHMEWELVGADFGGVERMPRLAAQQKISAQVRSVGDDYRIATTRTAVRRAIRVPDKLESSDICITYILKLVDLQIANEVDKSGFYIPDSPSGNFRVVTPGGEGRFDIRLPKLFDENWQLIQAETWHTLRQVGKNTYEYCKLSGKSTLEQLRKSIWIDADTTLYGSTNDGWVSKTSASWAASIAATSGSGSNNSGNYVTQGAAALQTNWECIRSFVEFDTSAITATDKANISGCQLKLYPYNTNTCTVSLFTGTQSDSLGTADFDNFGSEIDRLAWSSAGWNTFNFAGSAITAGGRSKFCLREYAHDVSAVQPSDDTSAAGFYFADNTGITYDPTLIITIGELNSSLSIIRNYYNRRLVK